MIPLIETANNEGEEIILLLMHHLPSDIASMWHGIDDWLAMLQEGGITTYTTQKQISDRIKTQKRFNLESNRFSNKRWYALNENMAFPAPKHQLKSKQQRPRIEPNYFTNLGIKFKYIGVKSKPQATTAAAAAASNNNNNNITAALSTAASSTAANNNNNNNNSSTNKTHNNNNNTHVVTPINKKTNNATNKSTTQKKSTSSTPSIEPGTTGYMLASLNIVDDVLSVTNDHQSKCNCRLQVTKKNRHGFEVITKMSCNYCKRVYKICNGPKPVDDATTKKRGVKTSQLNMTVTNAMHMSAVQIGQMQQLCMEIGCVAPSETGMHGMMSKRKKAAAEVAEEILRENRREHVREVLKLNPNHTIMHIDADGKIHKICRGGAAGDGAGDKRAYNHIITGSQHCTVVFSIITGKVLAIKHDQLSCGRCSRRLNKLLLEENKSLEDITEDDLKHDGECSINSKHGPAVAEEHALEWIAEYLLIDPLTKKLRNDEIGNGTVLGGINLQRHKSNDTPCLEHPDPSQHGCSFSEGSVPVVGNIFIAFRFFCFFAFLLPPPPRRSSGTSRLPMISNFFTTMAHLSSLLSS